MDASAAQAAARAAKDRRNERDRERRKKRKAAKMAAAEEEKAMGGTEELPALAWIRAEQERIKKQRQSLNSYERKGKAMFAKLRSLCAVPDREEVEEQDDSDEEEDLEKTELKEEVQDLKEEVEELKKKLDEAKKEQEELEEINEGLFNDYYSDKSDLAKHYKHLVETYFREGHNFWYSCEDTGPGCFVPCHAHWIEQVGAKLLPRKPTFG